ncbi:MAG: hypothetical protein ACKVP5_03750 [Aestuariivirga sp.]
MGKLEVQAGTSPRAVGDERILLNPSAPPAGTGGAGAGSLFDVDYGTQEMKAYPLTEEQIESLSHLGLLATACFSVAAGIFGFSLDLHKDLALTAGADEAAVAYWSAVRTGGFIAAFVLAGAGLGFFLKGRSKIKAIKSRTRFDNGQV